MSDAPPGLTNAPLLDGAQNFRAVKPYAAASGRRLRAEAIYRSGELSRLSAADQARVAACGIRLVCDLRSASERSEYPTVWPGGAAEAPHWLDLPEREHSHAAPGKIFDIILAHPGDAGAVKAMHLTYRRKPEAWAAPLRTIFETLCRGHSLPLLIHCHAGKDRTGYVTAMLLAAAGVNRADILDDYLTTTIFYPVARESVSMAEWARRSFGRAITPEQAVPMVEARPEYLLAAFERIDAEHGGVDRYLRETVGLTDAARSRLQGLLLV